MPKKVPVLVDDEAMPMHDTGWGEKTDGFQHTLYAIFLQHIVVAKDGTPPYIFRKNMDPLVDGSRESQIVFVDNIRKSGILDFLKILGSTVGRAVVDG